MPKRSTNQVSANQPKTTPVPKTGKKPTIDELAATTKSIIRNTLLASPDFPRLYADVVISSAPNSNEANILAKNYKKICDIDWTNMTTQNKVKVCAHIKVTGVRCGSPTLRGEQFCYFHQRMLRTVKGPDSRLHHVALLENSEAIQASIMEVVNALIRGTIDLPRAELVLRALNTAVRNIRGATFENVGRVVTTIPDYSDPHPSAETAHAATAAPGCPGGPAVPVRSTVDSKPSANMPAAQAHVATAASASRDRVGTAVPGCPSGPEVSVRSAVASSPVAAFTKHIAAVDPTTPKAPVSDRSSQVLQSHKHRTSSG
jgi:hypothetical protein